MHLTGSDAHTPGQWALTQWQTFLAAKLGDATLPYKAQFVPYGGVAITTKPEEALQWVRSKRPFIFLSFDEGDHQRELWRVPVELSPTVRRGVRHTMTLIAELVTPPASLPGVQQLRDAIGDIVDRYREPLRLLGLEEASFAPDSAREAAGNHVNPHALGCVVYSL